MAKKFKVVHDRENCIGCGACAAIAPDYWIMNDDGKADLLEGKPQGRKFIRMIDEKELQINKEAADSCPVEVIHVEDEEGKKK